MSEYLTFIQWRNQEQRLPHELERQRVIQERLDEQGQHRAHHERRKKKRRLREQPARGKTRSALAKAALIAKADDTDGVDVGVIDAVVADAPTERCVELVDC